MNCNELWKKLNKKFPMYRDEMTEEQERAFVDECFKIYEKEGFAKVFWSMGGDYKEYHNKPFTVIRRTTEENCHLSNLPMWDIKFEDGFELSVYPDEVIPSEMKDHGCKLNLK